MNLRGVASALTLTAAAVILTITTGFLAPLPLMLLRRNGGRTSFVMGVILASALLIWFTAPSVVGAFLTASILTFVFSESEGQNLGYTSSVFVTLLVLVGLGAMATGYAMEHYGFDPVSFFRIQIGQALSQVTLPAGVSIDKEALLKQLPSAFVILIVVSIWLNSVLVPRIEILCGWIPAYLNHTFSRGEFRSWKLPEPLVWIALLATAGTFFDVKPDWLHWLAANVFNVMVMLYFFQGLAIVVDFFVVKRVSPVWRVIAYLFIFSQLFLMVACLGFVDLWVGFRNRTKTDKSAVA